MQTYLITFTDTDGDTCEVDQHGHDATDAIARVHVAYGHLNRTGAYVARGITYRATDTAVATAVVRHRNARARRRPNQHIGGYR